MNQNKPIESALPPSLPSKLPLPSPSLLNEKQDDYNNTNLTNTNKKSKWQSIADLQLNKEKNLLKFKVEVLTNMLAIEKREKEVAIERLEVLQIYYRSKLASNNASSDTDTPPIPIISNSEINIEGYEIMSSAISNLRIDYRNLREDIQFAFAGLHTVQPHEFVRKLYNCSQNISKKEAEYLAQKFFDGVGVSFDDFINFFEKKHDEFENQDLEKNKNYKSNQQNEQNNEQNDKKYDAYDDNQNDDYKRNDNKNDNQLPDDDEEKIKINNNSDTVEMTESDNVVKPNIPPPKPDRTSKK